MKIFSANQIREADAYTISNEPILSIELMERAARAFVGWFSENFVDRTHPIKIFCGLGDNGGDGLAIARMLHPLGYNLEVYVIKYSEKKSDNFLINLERLEMQLTVQFIDSQDFIFNINENDLIIDAIFGSGLSRPLGGLVSAVVEQINNSEVKVISVDVPSGLMIDKSNGIFDTIIHATHTVSFQLPKLAFMLPQNAEFVGDWHIVEIGLDLNFIQNTETKYFYSMSKEVEKLVRSRKKFSHKGTFGHGLLVAGSYGMMGAAVLSGRACMRSGVGKLTVHSVTSGLQIMQTLLPEAMYWESLKKEKFITTKSWDREILAPYQAVGIGPGIGVKEEVKDCIEKLFEVCSELKIPMVIDADALNNISNGENRDVLKKIPKNAILTPHPKEFQKLLNVTWKDDYEKLSLLVQFAVNQGVIVCLKGANTAIALPDGTIHFNSSGNAGMATAGSGDVLTGMILALVAQGYSPQEAAIFGVYQHGLAGDRAAENKGMTNMIASDIVEHIRF